jgi:hypothetical protein
VRVLTPTERRLVRDHWEEYKKRTKSRILIQQLEDGFPTFRHYGIDLGDGTIVHFRGKLHYIHANAWIQRTDYDGFAQGGQICYADDVRLAFSQDRIMDRALSQVGSDFGGYHFLCNNCEHFTNWCACGKRISRQVLMR